MTYEAAIKVVWPRAYQSEETGVWFVGTSGNYAPITFDAMLAVWRERLDGWDWARSGDDLWLVSFPENTRAIRPWHHGTSNPIHDFTILTALALQAKEKT